MALGTGFSLALRQAAKGRQSAIALEHQLTNPEAIDGTRPTTLPAELVFTGTGNKKTSG
ncbi:MAG TPA: hypothetical protein VK181_15025 [Rhizobium sp.]|nr:hypothetical protein [Rhizobium sp.]